MDRKIACVAFALVLALPLVAFPADPFFRFSRGNAPVEASFSFANDAFGPGPMVEWDDLDSYGFRLVLPLLKGLSFGMVYDGMTDRGDEAADASRMDLISACLGFDGTTPLFPWLDLRANAFLGLRAMGDFAAIALQEGWHSGQGIQRPVPLDYDTEDEVCPLLGFDLSLAPPWALAPYGCLAMEWAPASSWLAFSSLGLAYREGGASIALAAGWVSGDSADETTTLGSVMGHQLGLAFAFSAKVGYLSLELQSLALNGVSSGSIGLVFSSSRPRENEEAPSAIRLSYGLALGEAAAPGMRIEWLAGKPSSTLVGGFFASTGNGWIGKQAAGSAAPRFSEYAAGALLEARSPRGRLSAGVGLGLRLSMEGLFALSLERSSILERRVLADLDLEGTARLSFAPSGAYPFGLGLKARWTPLSIAIIASPAGFAGRPGLELQAFVFSSTH